VFRYRAEGPGEFVQAGLESFGRVDRAAADAEILTLALEAADSGGAVGLSTRIGDVGLFAALLDALDLPDAWKRRIRRGHAKGLPLEAVLVPANGGGATAHDGVLAALTNADPVEARALVEDLLSIAGITAVGGRSVAEIAQRFLEQASARGGAGPSEERVEVLRRYFAITGDPDACSLALRDLARDARLDLEEAFDAFDARLNFIMARGLDLANLSFSARFGRQLDYYTGFVFEAVYPNRPGAPVAGGGRYDRLARGLGAGADVPAVGAAIWCERLVAPTSPQGAAP
jgi:ATP phosphoribosyltransferase regulatory subunit